MKTVFATIALSLVCAVSLAKSVDSTVGSRLPSHIDGSAYAPVGNMALDRNSVVVLAKRLDSTVGSRLPRYIDGSAYEQSANMSINEKSPAEARTEAASFDRLRAALSDLLGGRT